MTYHQNIAHQDALKLCMILEDILVNYYGFEPHTSAREYINPITDESRELIKGQDMNPDRGATLFCLTENNLDIGIYLAGNIIDSLPNIENLTSLSTRQLDAILVLIEEISHFHLILNRCQSNKPFSLLELEFQAEIDKILVASLALEKLLNQCLFRELAGLSFYSIDLVTGASTTQRYAEAQRLARNWYHQLIARNPFSGNPTLRTAERDRLVSQYWLDLPQKLSA